MTQFSANILNLHDFTTCLYPVMLSWQRNTCQLNYQNTEDLLSIPCFANLEDLGINSFEKSANAAQVSKTVFSHLKYVFTLNNVANML